MTDEIDIYRAAKLVIDQQGDAAIDYALKRSDELLKDGDGEGAATWRLILNAIAELQREPAPDERLH